MTKIPRGGSAGGLVERGRRRAMPLKLASSIGNELVHELDDLGRPMLRGAGHAVSSGLSAIRAHPPPPADTRDIGLAATTTTTTGEFRSRGVG